MTRGLFFIPFMCFLCSITTTTTFAQSKNLQNLITHTNKELNIVVVDAPGFLSQDNVQPDGYKSRHSSNVQWFMDNWYTFSKSVREGKSYRTTIDAATFKSLTATQKSKLEELYGSCFTGKFDPVGLVNSQLSKIGYSPKFDENNEHTYQKQVLTQQFIDEHAQTQRAIVIVLNKQTAAQISAILTNN